jgi:hypothetical protein
MPIFMASGFFRPFGKKRQSRAANPDEREMSVMKRKVKTATLKKKK